MKNLRCKFLNHFLSCEDLSAENGIDHQVVARLRKSNWMKLVFFRDRLLDIPARAESTIPSSNLIMTTFEEGLANILQRKWTFHDAKDREYGPRGYKG